MTMESPDTINVLCNYGTSPPLTQDESSSSTLRLDYRANHGFDPNVNINLPGFIMGVNYLPPRILDLLELAAYVYCADRYSARGAKDNVEYQRWSRSFEFCVKVRDHTFWSDPKIGRSLSQALQFMTGDKQYQFVFESGHSTPPVSLFDQQEFQPESEGDISVMLFSGGLDSLTGAIDILGSSSDRVCLVSHQSQASTKKTQNRLVESLQSRFPERVVHYPFGCSLSQLRARDENQRTRVFLYTSIAFAIAQVFSRDRFYVFENGVTSINFPRRADLGIARASRTTHPQTISWLREFFSLVAGTDIRIELPYLWKTKSEVIQTLNSSHHRELISSSVSCGRVREVMGQQATHCGVCSQCIDRRIGAYAANAEDWDDVGIYGTNIIFGGLDTGSQEGREAKTVAVDYIRQARNFATWNLNQFEASMLNELSDIVDFLPDVSDEFEAVERIWELSKRHGNQILTALNRIRNVHDEIYETVPDNSLLKLIASREFLKEPLERLIESVRSLVETTVPVMFRTNPPVNENDLNAKVSAHLQSHFPKLRSEHPALSFACGYTVPDHSIDYDLWIESKFIRGGTTPSKASDGIAADLTKYPSESHKLFLVYDPDRAIHNDDEYRDAFESKGRCTVCILR